MPHNEEEVIIEAEIVDVPVEDMEELQKEAERMQEEIDATLNALAQDISGKFSTISGRRQTKEREWLEATRLHLGSLSAGNTLMDSDHPFRGKSKGSKPSHNLVRTKCTVAIAKGISSQFSGGDKNWAIRPSPLPDIDPSIATIKAHNMEKKIEDQLEDENYGYKCRLAYQDRVILGTGILKGPVSSTETKLSYQITDDGMGNIVTIPTYMPVKKAVLKHVSPWMFFPDDTVNDIREASFAIELHPMSKLQVAKLLHNPGFIRANVEKLLGLEPESYSNPTFSEYSVLTDSGQNFLRDKFAIMEYNGPISIDQLGALGIEPSYDPLGEMFFGEIWCCQGIIIRAELEVLSGMYELPYMVCPWLKDPNSVFGFGLPLEIKDPQKIAEVTLDMILENASISSGPIGIINKSFIEPFDGEWSLYPHKLFGTTDYTLTSVDNAMTFINVPNRSGELFPILQFARDVAQEESGVPLMAAGLQSPTVQSDSATGLAIQDQKETVVSDFKSEEWDDMVTNRLIKRWYHWNMQYDPTEDTVGDFEIDVKSSTEYRNKQLFIRDIEKLSVEAAQNPALAQVINMDELQRVRLTMMHIPSKSIIKSPEQIEQERQEAQNNPPPPDPNMMKAEAEMARVEVDREKMALEREKLQFEMTMQQRREEMNHAERMGANYMRQLEAEARVMEAEAQRQVELLKLSQKSESDQAWVQAELQKSILTDQTNKFMAGLDAQKSARDAALKAAELAYANRHGKGI